LNLSRNQLTSLPAEIGKLTLLEVLALGVNQLTSLPAEIWQLTPLRELYLDRNQLTRLPAENGQTYLNLSGWTSLPAQGLGFRV